MTSRPPVPSSEEWVATHHAYDSAYGRLAVLFEASERFDETTWFAVDLDGELELATLGDHGGTAPTHTPCCLAPHLFPGGLTPSVYPLLLAVTTNRAVAALREPRRTEVDAGVEVVAHELLVLYRELIPDPAERLAAMFSHVDWLERVARRGGLPDPGEAAAVLTEPVTPLPAPDLEVWGRELGCGRGRVVARLAHTHALRLWGPGADRVLLEGHVLRQIASTP